MQHNILITSAGKRVALTRYFKETLNRFYPDAKVFTTDMNPDMAPAGYVSDGCFKVPKVTDKDYPALLLEICEKNEVGMVIATIDTELLLLADLKADFARKGILVMVSDRQFVEMCRDKRNTGAFFCAARHTRAEGGGQIPSDFSFVRQALRWFAEYQSALHQNG